MSLELLPNELKRCILKSAPDIDTLSALVHSSPSYHTVYRTFREECLTHLTLNDLRRRDIDVLIPASFIEFNTWRSQSADLQRFLKTAIEDCYRCIKDSEKIRLCVDKCRALMTLRSLTRWYISADAHHLYIKSTWRTAPCTINFPGVRRDHDHEIEITRNEKFYGLGWSEYRFIAFDQSVFSGKREPGSPSLAVMNLSTGTNFIDSYIACRVMVRFPRSNLGVKAQGREPAEEDLESEGLKRRRTFSTYSDGEEYAERDEDVPIVFSLIR